MSKSDNLMCYLEEHITPHFATIKHPNYEEFVNVCRIDDVREAIMTYFGEANCENTQRTCCDDTSETDKLRAENVVYRKIIDGQKVELEKCRAIICVVEQFTDTRLPKIKTDF